jgi:DNA processing protein
MISEEAEAWLALNGSKLSPGMQRLLVEGLGSARAVLAADEAQAAELPGVNPLHLRHLDAARRRTDLGKLRELCVEHGVHLLSFQDAEYPARLAEVPEGAPPLLFVQGELTRDDAMAVAMVGTRKATPYGLTTARRLAADLARRGFTIVSGMALGVDAEAHEGALEASGRTVAIMATGADITYPGSHQKLRARIAESGAVLTELAFGSTPTRYAFPARNRIIAGLSLGTIVVEADRDSGALITAEHALEQGREVFAVPGSIESPYSRGCHELIKEGAHLVETAEDVVAGLGLMLQSVPTREARPVADLSRDEQTVYDALGPQPLRVDQLVESTGLPTATLNATLMLLEIKGLARRFAGGAYLRLQ